MKKYEFELIIKKEGDVVYYKKNLPQSIVNILIGIENVLNAELRNNRNLLYDFLPEGSVVRIPDEEFERMICSNKRRK